MRIKVTLAYDGSKYCGWQIQPNGTSIQGVVEKVISEIQKVETTVEASGRTDARVHAKGQVFHFDTSLTMNTDQWTKALNAKLPDDMRAIKVEVVHDEFHSRFDAKWKNYDYYVNVGDYNPFQKDYVLQYCRKLNVELMKECAKMFVGTHDFTSFNGNSLIERPNQVRTIYDIQIEEKDDVIIFHYYGEGFLRYMVRMLTQTMIEVGKERVTLEHVKKALDCPKKQSAPYNASPVGLYLVKVGYEDYGIEK